MPTARSSSTHAGAAGLVGMTLIALACSATAGESEPAKSPDWARQYLADDPLAAREHVSLDDMREGIERNGAEAIRRHFARVHGATAEEKIAFLRGLLGDEDAAVRRQAAIELAMMGYLDEVVRGLLLECLSDESPMVRAAALTALARASFPDDDFPAASWPALIDALGAPDANARRAAGAPPPPTVAKAVPQEGTPRVARVIEPTHPRTVRVYYGTNREVIEVAPESWSHLILPPVIVAMLLLGIVQIVRAAATAPPERRHGCRTSLLVAGMLVAVGWSLVQLRFDIQTRWRLGTGPQYGPRRDPAERTHYGICDISIPPSHRVGQVERPTFGPENEAEHVVIRRTEEWKEEIFFERMQAALQEVPEQDRACFVFIHGFNVDFENAARRTAQIHHDLQFRGIPIFFSWPSRATIRHYFSDRNEIEFSRYVIKQFLVDVAERVKAERIHVIAHSMGADATCRAIAELGERGKIFDQIILAAPDIDREVFRRQIAPRMTRTANRTTLYCSRNDLALMASRSFNDSLRAGDSSRGALVLESMDTVDASDIDTDLLGHSYYGDCMPLLEDVRKLLEFSSPPAERHLKAWPAEEELIYWTLPESAPSASP
jgi:esterase/lipase superfamily enzyme